ncbi:hypothetical protein [Neisseria elongata]|jgi:hypothetical protein
MADKEKAAEYRKKYEKSRVMKGVSFHREREAQLLKFAEKIDFSLWVKEKIKEELKK